MKYFSGLYFTAYHISDWLFENYATTLFTMNYIRYLQVDGISVCFSPEKISKIFSEVAKVSEPAIQMYYNVNPSLLDSDPVSWYQTATQRARFPVEWMDTELAYNIITKINTLGFADYSHGWSVTACREQDYLVEPRWQIKYARLITAYNIVSDDEESLTISRSETKTNTISRKRARVVSFDDDIDDTISELSLGSSFDTNEEDGINEDYGINEEDNYIINVIEDNMSDITEDYKFTDAYCFKNVAKFA
jgi:hypothetical protein